MKQRNWSEGILPAIVVVYGIAYVAQTHHLPWNAILYPYALLGMIALLLVFIALRQRARGDEPAIVRGGDSLSAPAGQQPVRQSIGGGIANAGLGLSLIVGTFVYPWIIESFGFVLTTGLYLLVLFRVFKSFRLVVIGPLALAISVILSVFLQHVLDLNLPSFGFAELPFGM